MLLLGIFLSVAGGAIVFHLLRLEFKVRESKNWPVTRGKIILSKDAGLFDYFTAISDFPRTR